MRLIRDGAKEEGGMEVGEEGDYIPITTLCPSQLWNIKMALTAAHINAEVILVVTVSTVVLTALYSSSRSDIIKNNVLSDLLDASTSTV